MSSGLNLESKNFLILCPFSKSCVLPKLEHLCRFPECKLCPDYDSKLQKLKDNS